VIRSGMEKFSVKVLLFTVQLLNVTHCKLKSVRTRKVEVRRVKKNAASIGSFDFLSILLTLHFQLPLIPFRELFYCYSVWTGNWKFRTDENMLVFGTYRYWPDGLQVFRETN
jgi:hypothetical protein